MALDSIFSAQSADTTSAGDAMTAGMWERRWSGVLAGGARVICRLDGNIIDGPVNITQNSPNSVVFNIGAGEITCELVGADYAHAQLGFDKTSVTLGFFPVA